MITPQPKANTGVTSLDALRSPTDGGPIYAETRLDRPIAEPLNALTAAVFLGVAIYWWRRVAAQRSAQRLIVLAAPILALGGLGGTLYHALRSWRGFLLMDFLPILILTLLAGAHFTRLLLRSWWQVAAVLLPLLALPQLLFYLARIGIIDLPMNALITISYAFLGLIVAGPIAWSTVRFGAQHWRWLVLALGSFLLALACRALDRTSASVVSVGTHWLWHLFGALATASVLALIYRINGDLIRAAPTSAK